MLGKYVKNIQFIKHSPTDFVGQKSTTRISQNWASPIAPTSSNQARENLQAYLFLEKAIYITITVKYQIYYPYNGQIAKR